MPMPTFEGLEVPSDVLTLEGFRAWVETLDESAPLVSFLGGDVHVEMTPQSYRSHAPLVTEVNAVLRTLARESRVGMYFAPPSWFTCPDADLSTEPDGFLVTFESLRAGAMRVHAEREHEMVGRPDMVLEVVSASSRKKDLQDLVERYALAGTREYWIADARGEDLAFRILVLEGDAYRAQTADAEGWFASPVWGRAFRLTRLVNEVGLVDYRLESR